MILIYFDELFDLYLPWIVFFGMIFTFVRLYLWARNKKTGALIIGLLIQMVIPDPRVEQTIEVVQEQRKTTKEDLDEKNLEKLEP